MNKKLFATMVVMQLSACATPFPYVYWRVDMENDKAVGDKPENDKVMHEFCGLHNNQYNCMVTTIDSYVNLKSDYTTKTDRLIELERRCGGQQ